MCGIAGIIGEGRPGDQDLVSRMTDLLAHRGPDDQGVKRYSGATLGHRRLSILDLSEGGHQPMESHDGRYVVVFNGEIYNYKELQRELRDRYVFRSHSDTEVLLAAWIVWGESCLERLVGMYAFCIYDTRFHNAFFARDRFGQKPLFIAEHAGRLVFGSEIKALLAAGVPAKANPDAWSRYLIAASYDDSTETFFAGISQLRPGEQMHYRGGTSPRRSIYYRLSERVEPVAMTPEAAAEGVRERLVDACRIHMRADVPIAVSLSGGLDSSALLACLGLADELQDDTACLAVDFGSDYSERRWIEAAAQHHGLTASIMTYTPDDFHQAMRPMMWHLEGPLGGLMNNALAKLMGYARSRGFEVLQDGTGLDEAFCGYRNHHNLYLGLAFQRQDPRAERLAQEYSRHWGVDAAAAKRSALAQLDNSVSSIDGTLPVRPDLLSSEFLKAHAGDLSETHAGTTGDRLRDALVDYLQVRKIPRNTRMKDRVSMAFGVELRVPFLDHRLIEFALSIPNDHHLLHGRSKSMVREALAGVMSDEVRIAPKRSVHAPQGPWLMQEPMRSYVRGLIESDSFASRGLFDASKVRAAFDKFCAVGSDNSFFVWQWINVEEWYRMFIDGDPLDTSQSFKMSH